MKRFHRSRKGFTLIELAIVLVIIGIIIGAVLKGQDLIQNARAKRFINWDKQWETAQWTFMDRKGRFAGDSDSDGIIGEETTPTSSINEITNANFVNSPTETITLGSYTFFMKMGNDTDSVEKNVIVICSVDDCGTAIASDELMFFESIDTSIDGSANAGTGNVRAITAAPTLDANCSVSNECVDEVTEDTTTGDWTTGDYGLVYYFDRPHS